jgi:hypothetical protein
MVMDHLELDTFSRGVRVAVRELFSESEMLRVKCLNVYLISVAHFL